MRSAKAFHKNNNKYKKRLNEKLENLYRDKEHGTRDREGKRKKKGSK